MMDKASVRMTFYECKAPTREEAIRATINECDAPIYSWLNTIAAQGYMLTAGQAHYRQEYENRIMQYIWSSVDSCESNRFVSAPTPSTEPSLSVSLTTQGVSGGGGSSASTGPRASFTVNLTPLQCQPVPYPICHKAQVAMALSNDNLSISFVPGSLMAPSWNVRDNYRGVGPYEGRNVFTYRSRYIDGYNFLLNLFRYDVRIVNPNVVLVSVGFSDADNPRPPEELFARSEEYDQNQWSLDWIFGVSSYWWQDPNGYKVFVDVLNESKGIVLSAPVYTGYNLSNEGWKQTGQLKIPSVDKKYSPWSSWAPTWSGPSVEALYRAGSMEGTWRFRAVVNRLDINQMPFSVTWGGVTMESGEVIISNNVTQQHIPGQSVGLAYVEDEYTLDCYGSSPVARIVSIDSVMGVGALIGVQMYNPTPKRVTMLCHPVTMVTSARKDTDTNPYPGPKGGVVVAQVESKSWSPVEKVFVFSGRGNGYKPVQSPGFTPGRLTTYAGFGAGVARVIADGAAPLGSHYSLDGGHSYLPGAVLINTLGEPAIAHAYYNRAGVSSLDEGFSVDTYTEPGEELWPTVAANLTVGVSATYKYLDYWYDNPVVRDGSRDFVVRVTNQKEALRELIRGSTVEVPRGDLHSVLSTWDGDFTPQQLIDGAIEYVTTSLVASGAWGIAITGTRPPKLVWGGGLFDSEEGSYSGDRVAVDIRETITSIESGNITLIIGEGLV